MNRMAAVGVFMLMTMNASASFGGVGYPNCYSVQSFEQDKPCDQCGDVWCGPMCCSGAIEDAPAGCYETNDGNACCAQGEEYWWTYLCCDVVPPGAVKK